MTATATTAPAAHEAPEAGAAAISTTRGAMLVARREIVTAIRTPAFIWSLVVTVGLIVLLIVGQKFIGDFIVSAATGGERPVIATTADPQRFEDAGLEVVQVATAAEALDKVRSGEVGAAWLSGPEAAGAPLLTPDGAPMQVPISVPGVVVGLDQVPQLLQQALTQSPVPAQLEQGSGLHPALAYFMAVGLGVVYFMSVMMFAQRIAQSVVEEKASRIVELLLATLRPRTIIAGKVIGGTVLAVGQVAIIVAIALGSFALSGQLGFAEALGPAMLWFTLLFVVGFVLFAALYAGLGATVARAEDVASAVGPLTWLVMIPYMLVVMFSTNAELMGWLSYIPFSAPVAMAIRLYQGGAEWWEPILSLGVLVITAAIAIWIGAKLYENAVLRTQGKVKVVEALRGA